MSKKESKQENSVQDTLSVTEEDKSLNQDKEKKKKSGKRKKRKWLRTLIIVVIIIVVLAVLFLRGGNGSLGYTQETAQLRDIITYHSFTGTIEPVEDEDVMPSQAGLKVQTVNVEEGDQVHAGDVLMQLDTTDLDEQVKELQATISTTKKNNDLAVQLAQKTYDDYKNNMDAEQNSSILTAQQNIDNAYASLVTAQQQFNNEVTLNNDGLSQTILTAIQNVDSAYNSVRSAKATYEQVDETGTNVHVAQASLDGAWSTYSDAVDAFEAAKQNEENNLTSLYDSIVQYQQSYLNAIETYNATVTTADQQLETYALQLEQARAQADDTVNTLKLADLQRQVSDCTVKASMDGYVTSLPADVGEVTISGTALATVTNFDQMKIEIKINEYDILGVEEGKEVDVDVDALDKTYQGTITKIAKVATIDNGVSYFDAEVDFDADDDTRSGMSVEVKLNTNDLKQVLTVPTAAISTEDDGTAYVEVYGADGKTIEHKTVTCGPSDGLYTQITDGLSEGDTVLEPITSTVMTMYSDSNTMGQ